LEVADSSIAAGAPFDELAECWSAFVFEHSSGADLDPVVVCCPCGDEASSRSLTARFNDPEWTSGRARAEGLQARPDVDKPGLTLHPVPAAIGVAPTPTSARSQCS
jgi:hypothetical protein